MPGVRDELTEVPETLAPFWQWDFCSFHSPTWWRRHWEKTGKVQVARADLVEDGWQDWLRFDEETAAHASGWRQDGAVTSAAMVRADAGQHLGFCRMVAAKT